MRIYFIIFLVCWGTASAFASDNCDSNLKSSTFSNDKTEVLRYADVKEIFQSKCATCHSGPFLDISDFPFVYDDFGTDQVLIVEEFLRRMRLPKRDEKWKLPNKQRMPPINAEDVTQEQIQLIERWLAEGLLK